MMVSDTEQTEGHFSSACGFDGVSAYLPWKPVEQNTMPRVTWGTAGWVWLLRAHQDRRVLWVGSSHGKHRENSSSYLWMSTFYQGPQIRIYENILSYVDYYAQCTEEERRELMGRSVIRKLEDSEDRIQAQICALATINQVSQCTGTLVPPALVHREPFPWEFRGTGKKLALKFQYA